MDIDHTPAGWARNLGVISKLQAENELLRLKLDDAEAQLRLYRITLRESELIRHGLANEVAEMRFGSRQQAVIIPIVDVVA